jgi:GntR family transcriptional repressor for pyruvate dehydrogenase complex
VARSRRPQIGRESLADTVAEATLRLAAQERLRAGDALPPVTGLADRFQVSRAVVREALEKLAAEDSLIREGRRWVLTSKPRPSRNGARNQAGPDTLESAPAVAHRSLADQVADAVLELILTRRLREGDPLPPSGELAQHFGVSLIVMREALAALAARGILHRRQGRESVVALPSHELVSSILRMRAYLSDIEVDDFQAARATLEAQAASLAAQHAGGADHDELLGLVEAMRSARNEDAFNEHDLAFHLAVARMSGNRAIELLLASLNDIVRLTLDVSYRRIQSRAGREGIEHAVGNHERVAKAIIAGDAIAAGEAMEAHFSYVAPAGDERRLARG